MSDSFRLMEDRGCFRMSLTQSQCQLVRIPWNHHWVQSWCWVLRGAAGLSSEAFTWRGRPRGKQGKTLGEVGGGGSRFGCLALQVPALVPAAFGHQVHALSWNPGLSGCRIAGSVLLLFLLEQLLHLPQSRVPQGKEQQQSRRLRGLLLEPGRRPLPCSVRPGSRPLPSSPPCSGQLCCDCPWEGWLWQAPPTVLLVARGCCLLPPASPGGQCLPQGGPFSRAHDGCSALQQLSCRSSAVALGSRLSDSGVEKGFRRV